MASALIHHVALETDRAQVEEARSFWALLAFVEQEPPEALRGFVVWFVRGSNHVHLLLSDNPVAAPAGHVALIFGDQYDDVLAKLEQAGHAADPHPEYWGSPRSFVRAPGGHLVELMRAPPA